MAMIPMSRGYAPLAVLMLLMLPLPLLAQEAKPPADAPPAAAVELNDLERAFVDQLSGAALVGIWSVDGRGDGIPKPERYTISRVAKLQDDHWVVEAQITYGNVDLKVPVPVKVHWAGDTPVLSVTNLTIPLMGSEFTARVMFYDGRYAATWRHGKVGGHMWGKIEKAADTEAAQPTAGPNDSAPKK